MPRWLRGLMLAYASLWVWAALAPLDRAAWLLENLLVGSAVVALVATHKRFAFSPLSLALIIAFLALHTIGTHYTYSAVPAGEWLRDALGLARNHYDRVVHFGFGLLLGYPLRELTLRRVHAHRVWSYAIPLLAILALGAVYEILEWLAASLVEPEVGIAFIGAQGDIWDGQKDMVLAWAGGGVAMAITALARAVAGEPYVQYTRLSRRRRPHPGSASGTRTVWGTPDDV